MLYSLYALLHASSVVRYNSTVRNRRHHLQSATSGSRRQNLKLKSEFFRAVTNVNLSFRHGVINHSSPAGQFCGDFAWFSGQSTQTFILPPWRTDRIKTVPPARGSLKWRVVIVQTIKNATYFNKRSKIRIWPRRNPRSALSPRER